MAYHDLIPEENITIAGRTVFDLQRIRLKKQHPAFKTEIQNLYTR